MIIELTVLTQATPRVGRGEPMRHSFMFRSALSSKGSTTPTCTYPPVDHCGDSAIPETIFPFLYAC